MKVILDVSLVPIGVGVSVSKYVAMAQKIFEKYDVQPMMHAYGTNVEGEWDTVMQALKECHEAIHGAGVPRITSSLRMGTRTDRQQTREDKLKSVRDKL